MTWLLHMCDMTHSYVRHDTSIYATWHNHMCDIAHSFVIQLICTRDMTPWYVRHECVLRRSRRWSGVRARLRWDSFIQMWYHSGVRATWLLHMYDMNVYSDEADDDVVIVRDCDDIPWSIYDWFLSYVRHDSFIRATWTCTQTQQMMIWWLWATAMRSLPLLLSISSGLIHLCDLTRSL